MHITVLIVVLLLFVAIVNRRIGAEVLRVLAQICALLRVVCSESAMFIEQAKTFCESLADSRMEAEGEAIIQRLNDLEQAKA